MGILGLDLFNPDLNAWGSSRTQAAWIFVHYVLENQIENQKILEVNYNEESKELNIILNK